MGNELTRVAQESEMIMCGGRPLAPVDALWRLADGLSKSTAVPKEFQGQPSNCFLALVLGWEHDIPPLTALTNTMVVNNRAKFFGSLPLGIVRRSGLFDEKQFSERFEGKDDEYSAVCTVARVGCPPITRTFSIRDAKRADLWGKDNWKKYPQRMLRARALGYALDDAFSDVLKGVAIPAETREDAVAFAGELPTPTEAPQQTQAQRLTAKVATIVPPSAVPVTVDEPATVVEVSAANGPPIEAYDQLPEAQVEAPVDEIRKRIHEKWLRLPPAAAKAILRARSMPSLKLDGMDETALLSFEKALTGFLPA